VLSKVGKGEQNTHAMCRTCQRGGICRDSVNKKVDLSRQPPSIRGSTQDLIGLAPGHCAEYKPELPDAYGRTSNPTSNLPLRLVDTKGAHA
jgi:hypothetical protein